MMEKGKWMFNLKNQAYYEESYITKCNTPCYGSPSLSLIIIISCLVMHDVTGLINSKSS
jgi:hypothetical protein